MKKRNIIELINSLRIFTKLFGEHFCIFGNTLRVTVCIFVFTIYTVCKRINNSLVKVAFFF